MCTNVKLLGIYLDSKLTWHEHTEHVCMKLSRVIYLLRHLKLFVSDTDLRMVYFALFHSVLSYGLLLWGNASNVSHVLIAQKKALRILSGADPKAHRKPLFVSFKILTVINQYILFCLLHVKKNLNNYILNEHVHEHRTRNRFKITKPFTRLCKVQTSHESMGISLFNRLPVEAHRVSINKFKICITNWLIANPFYDVQEFFEAEMCMLFS